MGPSTKTERRKWPSTHSRLWTNRMAARGKKRRKKKATTQSRTISMLKIRAELSKGAAAPAGGAAAEAAPVVPLVAAEVLVAAARTGMLKEREWVMSDREQILDRRDTVRYTSRTQVRPAVDEKLERAVQRWWY